VITITTIKSKEKQEIRESLIKSYEILEEKLNQTNEKINELESELKRGSFQGEKREKGRNLLPEQGENFISHE
jgi:predicted nuclease with TOPRIM domain